MGEKIECEWERDIPQVCRTCHEAKYIYCLASDAHRYRRENEEIRTAMRAAMFTGGKEVRALLDKWIGCGK